MSCKRHSICNSKISHFSWQICFYLLHVVCIWKRICLCSILHENNLPCAVSHVKVSAVLNHNFEGDQYCNSPNNTDTFSSRWVLRKKRITHWGYLSQWTIKIWELINKRTVFQSTTRLKFWSSTGRLLP